MTDATHMPASEPLERIQCQWCQGMNEKTALSCRSCGAPLDIRNLVSESGWREAPRIKDMTEFQFSSSTCQVEGEIVPVAEIHLGAGDSVFFEHHIMLWKEDSVPLTVLQLPGGMKRAFAGMPFIISVATGPGRIAFSRDATGELVVLPLHPGMEVDAREHAFLLASHQIDYSFVRIKGFANILFGGQGMYMDRFVTTNTPGLVMLHGYGNVFERMLKPGESILLEPGSFLYKDSSVNMQVEFQKLGTGFFGGTNMALARMTGPGRVGIQSMYVHHHTE
ncbi:MAG TPA: AIM24 family protein [Candidatus Sulfopaludibacter sp.]|nr:AIM24 family protein [Candidatus Sulfopaludibacter sp.]